MSNTIKKDFYNYLPAYLTKALDSCIEIYGNKPWFQEAWEEYRHMARSLNSRHMPAPNKFFGEKDYVNKLPEKELWEQATKYCENDALATEEVFKKHYEENFRPTVKEQVRKDFRNEKNNKFHKKNRKFNS